MPFLHRLFLMLLLGSSLHADAQGSIDYGNNAAAGKWITLNNVKHYYETYGQGPPLLLIHGNGTGIRGWAAQIAYFSQKYTVYAIDCRGRGKSELGKDSLSYRQQAIDMNRFLSALKLDSVDVIGKSDGAIVALLMAALEPERLKKVVAFSANLWPDTTALYPPTVAEVHDERVKAEAMLTAGDTTQNWILVRQRNRMMEFQPDIRADMLGKIPVPVLVITTDRDVIREEHTLFIYRHIRRAHLCVLPGETHHVPKQNPGLFNMMVDKFLSEPYKDQETRFRK